MATIFDNLLQQVTQTTELSSEIALNAAETLQADTARVRSLADVNITEGTQAVEMAKQAAGKTAAANFAQRSMKESAQNQLNLNPDVAENELQKSIAALNLAQTGYKAARGEFDKITNQNFFDDPLGYMVGRLNLPSVAARVNNASDMAAAAEGNIATRTQMLEQFSKSVSANTASTLQDAELKTAQANATLSQAKLRQSEIENIGRISGMNMQQVQIANIVTDNKVKEIQMRISAATAEAQREQASIAKKHFNMLAEERLAAMLRKKDAEAELNAGLKNVAGFFGLAVAPTVETLDKYPEKIKRPLLQAAMTGQFGADLKDSLAIVTQIPGANNIAAINPGAGLFLKNVKANASKYIDVVQREQMKPGAVKLKAGEIPLEAMDVYQQELVASATVPNFAKPLSSDAWDTTFNPYKANHKVMLDTVAAGQLPQLKDNVMVSALTTVAGSTGKGDVENLSAANEQRALGVVRELVSTRKITPQEAAKQVSDYYKLAAGKNFELYQYNVFGLPVQDKYNFTMKSMGMFGDPIKVDLMNPASVERAISKEVRSLQQATQAKVVQPFTPAMGGAGFAPIAGQVLGTKLQPQK